MGAPAKSAAAPARRGTRASDAGAARKQTQTNRDLQKRSVLEVAARLFMERGFAGTSMGDVAHALNVSRPTLYYYFESKDQILRSLVEEVTVSIHEMSRQVASVDEPADGKLYEMVHRHVLFIIENGTIFRVLTNSQMFLPDELKKTNDKAKAGIFRNFEKVITRGVEEGCFQAVDPGVAALTVIGMCNWASSWFKPHKQMTREEVASQIAGMATRSLLARSAGVATPQMHLALSSARDALDRMRTLLGPG